MASKSSRYTSKKPNHNGIIEYTDEEHNTWRRLYARQIAYIPQYACDEYLTGLNNLNLPLDHIPQLTTVSKTLMQATGWSIAQVPALISYERFFNLLAHRQFPSATFIRTSKDFDYLSEPDIFHEIFGHCPLLMLPIYADFMQSYGQLGQKATASEQTALARLYWFTVEFGLIETTKGLRCYGTGLLSSPSESRYALSSRIPARKPFDIIDALRTPYRIDIFQRLYFVIESFESLYRLLQQNLPAKVAIAKQLGLFSPTYPV